jgi:hypothetical protein
MDKYGPLLDGHELISVLKFASIEAFERCRQRGHLRLATVGLPKRRGTFALARDVAAYLAEVGAKQEFPCTGTKEVGARRRERAKKD